MPNIGTLAAKLTIDPANWKSGITSATSDLTGFSGFVERTRAALTKPFKFALDAGSLSKSLGDSLRDPSDKALSAMARDLDAFRKKATTPIGLRLEASTAMANLQKATKELESLKAQAAKGVDVSVRMQSAQGKADQARKGVADFQSKLQAEAQGGPGLGALFSAGAAGAAPGIGLAIGIVTTAIKLYAAALTAVVNIAGAAATAAVGFVVSISNGTPVMVAFLNAVAGVLDQIPLIGSVLATVARAGAGFFAWIQGAIDRLKEIGMLSRTFGIETQRMGALLGFAGGQADVLQAGLFRLARRLGEVAAGNAGTIGTFRALGFEGAQLAAMPLDQAFLRISARVRELPTAAERATLAFQLFGRSGIAMLPMLSRGTEAFAEFEQRFLAMGGGVSAGQAGELAAAERALNQIRLHVDAIRNQFAVQLAPYIHALADWFNAAALSGVNWGEVVASAVGTVIDVIGYVVEAVQAAVGIITEAWDFVRGFALQSASFFEGIGTGIATALNPVGALIDFFRPAEASAAAAGQTLQQNLGAPAAQQASASWGSRFQQAIRDIQARAQQLQLQGLAAGGTGPNLADTETLKQMADMLGALPLAKYGETLDKLRNMTRLGLPDDLFAEFRDKARNDLLQAVGVDISTPGDKYQASIRGIEMAQRAGALTAAEFADATRRAAMTFAQAAGINNAETGLQKIQDRLRNLQDLAGHFRFNMGDEIKKAQSELLGFDIGTPVEKFQARILDLDRWLEQGVIDANIYAQAISRAVGELDQASKGENKGPAALLEGTQAAMSAIAAFERGGQSNDPQERVRQALDRANQLHEAQLAAARDTAAAVRAMGGPPRSPLIARI